MDHHTTTLERVGNAAVVGIAGGSWMGLTFAEWNSIAGIVASVVTTIFTLVLGYFRLRKEYEKWRARREAKNSGLPVPSDDFETDRGGL